MKIGLLFGSYNPVHIGHLLLATRLRENAALDEVWLIVSPHNPHKQVADLEDEQHRLAMAQLATTDHPFIKVSDIEFNLPRPSYTHQTLKELVKQFSGYTFSVIIGEDNLEKFDTWKESGWIKSNFDLLVYNRMIEEKPLLNLSAIISLPLIDISATEIRKRIAEEKSIRYFVPDEVNDYIHQHGLYK